MIETVVYTTLAIIIILLIKDVFFPSEKTKIKRKKEKEEFIAKIFKDIKSNNHAVEIIGPDNVFTIDKPFMVIDYINTIKQSIIIVFIDDLTKGYSIRPREDLYELMKNKKVDTIIGKRIVFYDR
jgi:hypothetical protein